MKQVFRSILERIDERLPKYFLVKGGRLQVVPLSFEQYSNLVSNGYEPLVEGTYEELDKGILEALNALIGKLGNRAVLLYPLATSAIIAHEAGRPDTPLYKALRKGGNDDNDDNKPREAKRRKRSNDS
jgi:hypothetical protein